MSLRSPEYTESIELKPDCRIWKFANKITTLISNDSYQKSLRSFDTKEQAEQCLDIWKAKKYKGAPSSPASFFHKVYRTPSVLFSTNRQIQKYFSGGWQETFKSGYVKGPLFYYDMKSAYLWAGLQPLPMIFRPWKKGDKEFLVLGNLKKLPYFAPFYLKSSPVLVDHNDIEEYNLNIDIISGISWKQNESLVPVFEELQAFLPQPIFKKITQSYWGRWACSQPVIMETWKDGVMNTSTVLKNQVTHFTWATIIIHRVIRKLWKNLSHESVLVLTDAILSRRKIITGEKWGDFRLKAEFSDINVVAPGVWTKAPASINRAGWDKHAGYKKE